MIFLDKFFFWKNSINFWHPRLTLKVQFWHFLTNCHYSWDFFKDFSLVPCWFLAKKLAFKDPPSLKFHDRTDITGQVSGYKKWVNTRFCDSCQLMAALSTASGPYWQELHILSIYSVNSLFVTQAPLLIANFA